MGKEQRSVISRVGGAKTYRRATAQCLGVPFPTQGTAGIRLFPLRAGALCGARGQPSAPGLLRAVQYYLFLQPAAVVSWPRLEIQEK